MRKTILIGISLLAFILLTATTQVNAQWSAKVTWDDSNCSCATITKKVVEWTLFAYGTNTIVDQGTEDVTSYLSNEFTIPGEVTLREDTRFRLCVRVFYEAAQIVNPCCKAEKCEPTDSGELTNTPLLTLHLILE